MSDIELKEDEPVLFIQIRAMGDMLLTTPLIREFKRKYPSNPIDVVAQPLPAQVLVNNPHVRHVFENPKTSELRKQKYALSVDFLSTPGSALLSWSSRAKQRVGYRLRYRTMWYTHPVERRVEPLYNPLTKFDLVREIGLSPGDNPLPELFIRSEDDEWAEEKRTKEGLDGDKDIIGLAPWSKREWRRWSFESWIALLQQIREQYNALFVLFASGNEKAYLQPLFESLECQPRRVDTINRGEDGHSCPSGSDRNVTAPLSSQVRRPDSEELDSRLRGNDKGIAWNDKDIAWNDEGIMWAGADHILKVAALMKRCQMVITADNGLKHVAVASGVPTLTVYTGSEPEVWNPPDDQRHQFIMSKPTGANRADVEQAVELFDDMMSAL